MEGNPGDEAEKSEIEEEAAFFMKKVVRAERFICAIHPIINGNLKNVDAVRNIPSNNHCTDREDFCEDVFRLSKADDENGEYRGKKTVVMDRLKTFRNDKRINKKERERDEEIDRLEFFLCRGVPHSGKHPDEEGIEM